MLTVPGSRRCPSWGSIRVSEEAEGEGMCGREPLPWLPWEGLGRQVDGHGMGQLSVCSELWSRRPSCPVPGPGRGGQGAGGPSVERVWVSWFAYSRRPPWLAVCSLEELARPLRGQVGPDVQASGHRT